MSDEAWKVLPHRPLVKDKPAFRAQLEKFAEIPDLVRVLVAHHEPIDHEPKEALRKVAATI